MKAARDMSLRAMGASSQHPLGPALEGREQHLLYVTDKGLFSSEEVKPLVDACDTYVSESGISMFEIDVLPISSLKSQASRQAFVSMCSKLGMDVHRTEIVFCCQALPHADRLFKGELFRSAVLYTGNERGYVVGAISEVYKSKRGFSVCFETCPVVTKISVSVGDVFLLNPQHIHFANPMDFSSGNLLVLLQERITDSSIQERQATMDKHPFNPNIEQIFPFL